MSKFTISSLKEAVNAFRSKGFTVDELRDYENDLFIVKLLYLGELIEVFEEQSLEEAYGLIYYKLENYTLFAYFISDGATKYILAESFSEAFSKIYSLSWIKENIKGLYEVEWNYLQKKQLMVK